MNDVVAIALQKARAEFARSTTTAARQSMRQVRQLDRIREIDSRFYVMFEVACLFRDNSTAEATNTLRGIAPLSDAEWFELQSILGSAPENKFPAFVSACRGLRNQFTPPIILEPVSPTQSTQDNSISPAVLIATDELKESIATELLGGKSKQDIAAGLVQQGWNMESALRIINEVKVSIADHKSSPEGRRQFAKAYARHVLYGLICVCAGIGATWWSYKTATAQDFYWAFWGVIGYGVADFFYGLFGWIKYSD